MTTIFQAHNANTGSGGLAAAAARLSAKLANQRDLRDAAGAFSVRIGAALLAYALQIVLARTLDLEHYGLYVGLWSWLIVTSQTAVLGFSGSNMRFLPRYTRRGRMDYAKGFLKVGFATVAIGSTLFSAIAVATLYAVSTALPESYLLALYVLAFGLPLAAVELYLEGVSRSFGWYFLSCVPGYVVRPLLIATGVLAAAAMGYTPDTALALGIAVAVTGALAVGHALIILRRTRPMFEHVRAKPGRSFHWLKATLPLVFVAGVEELLYWSDILVLGMLVDPDQVGIYFAAIRSLAIAGFIHYAFMLVSTRQFSLARAARDPVALQREVTRATTWTFWLTVPAVLLTLALGYPLLALFGPEFTAGYPVMAITGLAFVARAAVGPATDLLIVLGHQRENLTIGAAALATNVLLAVLLVPQIGILGAAVSTAAAYTLRSIALLHTARRVANIRVHVTLPRLRPATQGA